MNLISRTLGLLSIIIGILIGYGIYLFLLNVYILSSWITTYLNAPQSLAIVITILTIISLLGAFILATVVALYLIVKGLIMVMSGDF